MTRISPFRNRRDAEQLLRGVDIAAVSDFFALSFDVAREIAEKRNGKTTGNTDFQSAMKIFLNNPCKDTAIDLLEKYPHLLEVFEMSKTVSNA
jgi:hypothetical protein